MSPKKMPLVRPRRRPLLTWQDMGVEPPTDEDLAALQERYGPPQPRDPLPGQPELPGLPQGPEPPVAAVAEQERGPR